ncbi:hypothetical protein OG824_13470 [Streptomyces prunicolor]|uniref:hypothetical protein n=1 Tax=Streptomyces prunicolor TaxID=67348 RepID=UPI00225AAA04|nr:hypothetical protein [Streptomyces prunicolor]MCX5236211.1 hypothetical protein [Streptomyces prunicolor]
MTDLPRQLSARTDAELARHIETLQRARLSYSEMVKWGVALLADVYSAAWEYQVVPIGETPELKSYVYNRQATDKKGPPWPAPDEESTDEAHHQDRAGLRDRRPTRLPGLDLPGVRKPIAEARDAAREGEGHPRIQRPEGALL